MSDSPRLITPGVWGEPLWRAIHVISMGLPQGAPEDTKRAYVNFFESLRTVLPCAVCAKGYSDIMDSKRPAFDAAVASGADRLFSWTVDVHNAVAEKLGQSPMSEDFVRDHYVFGDGRPPTGPGAPPGAAPGEEADGRKSDGPPWSEAVFRKHAANPWMVYSAALATACAVALVLWYASKCGVWGKRRV